MFAGKKLADKTHYIWLKDNEWLVYYEGVRVRFNKTMQGLENNFYGLAIACDWCVQSQSIFFLHYDYRFKSTEFIIVFGQKKFRFLTTLGLPSIFNLRTMRIHTNMYPSRFHSALDKIPNTTIGLTEPESLEDAIYRNVCQKQGDRQAAELLAQYARRELECLALTPTEAILEGRIKFSEAFRPMEEQAAESMVYSENKGVLQFALERLGLRPPTELEKVTAQVTMKNVGGKGTAPQ